MGGGRAGTGRGRGGGAATLRRDIRIHKKACPDRGGVTRSQNQSRACGPAQTDVGRSQQGVRRSIGAVISRIGPGACDNLQINRQHGLGYLDILGRPTRGLPNE